MTLRPHLARLAPMTSAAELDAETAAALLALEAATQDRPLGLESLLRETASDGIALVAHDGDADGAVIGFASARLLVDEVHVMRLAVDADHRRRGVGRALLDGLLRWSEEVHADALLLEVRAGNVAALTLYAQAGLAVDGHRPGYYPDGEDALLLRRVCGRA